MSLGLDDLAIIERIRRQRAKVIARRSVVVRPPRDPGSLLDFVPRVSPRFRAPVHLAPLAHAIERGLAGERVRACFSVPVRHGKTALLTHAIPWLLAKDPTRSILYVSYAHGFAKKQTAKARELSERWGIQLGSGRKKDEWTTRAGGQVKAAGIGGQITGEGFTDIFIDDPHKNRAEAESRIIREGVIEAFFSDIYTRLDPRGTSYYVVHARWNVNDLIGVLHRMQPHPFESSNAPALSADGTALAPWLFDAKQLEELRDTLGPYTWASLYQGEPRPRGGTLFKSPTLTSDLSTPRNYRTTIGIDLAWSTSTRADHNAAVVMRKNLDTEIIDVLEAVRARGTIMDHVQERSVVHVGFVHHVARLLLEHPGARIAMYAKESETPLVALFEKLLSEKLGYPVTVHTMKILRDKLERAMRYGASWNRGFVRLPGRSALSIEEERGQKKEAPHVEVESEDDGRDRYSWRHGFLTEHLEFTGVAGEEDDQVDAGAAAHDDLNEEVGTSLLEAMQGVRLR